MLHLLLLLCATPVFAEDPEPTGEVVISEVLWVGSQVSTADEWLEFYNTSEQEVSLAGWSVIKQASDGSKTVMYTFEEDAMIAAAEYQVLSNYAEDQSALTISPDYISTSVSLSNTKLLLEFIDDQGNVIDRIDDGVGTPFAGGKDPFSSMERIDLFGSGEEKGNWADAEASIGIDDVLATPGAARTQLNTRSSSLSSSSSESSVSTNIQITEILVDPIGSNDYSWIEIGNLGNDQIDITGWILSDGTRSYSIEPRSADGYVLTPGEHTVFFHYQTHIVLSDFDVITLTKSNCEDDCEVDRLPLSEAGEEVSIGRTEDGSRKRYCIPSPRKKNTENSLQPTIEIQSGRPTDYTKVTLNLRATTTEGSLKSTECFWDFDDGTSSEKCNPPSHSWDTLGRHDVTLTVSTECGEEIRKTQEVNVLVHKKVRWSSARSSERRFYSVVSSKSNPSVFSSAENKSRIIDQKLYSLKSAYSSSENLIANLPVRYVNVTTSTVHKSYASSVITQEAIPLYTAKNQQFVPSKNRMNQALPWVMLFCQSCLWVLLATKKLL